MKDQNDPYDKPAQKAEPKSFHKQGLHTFPVLFPGIGTQEEFRGLGRAVDHLVYLHYGAEHCVGHKPVAAQKLKNGLCKRRGRDRQAQSGGVVLERKLRESEEIPDGEPGS